MTRGVAEISKALTTLIQVLSHCRHKILDPYRPAFDPQHVASPSDEGVPPHRYLFHCYVYQYHLLQFATVLVSTVCKFAYSLTLICLIIVYTLLRLAHRDYSS